MVWEVSAPQTPYLSIVVSCKYPKPLRFGSKTKRMKKRLFVFWILLSLWSCGQAKREQMLEGSWQAVRVLEADSLLPVPVSVIRLHFDENHRYRYEGTLNYREAGFWRIKNHLLITQDSSENGEERLLRIQKLTEDSLFLEMQEAGRKRLMIMGKISD